MSIVRNIWRKGLVGKIVVGVGGITVACCACTSLVALLPSSSRGARATPTVVSVAQLADTGQSTAPVEQTSTVAPVEPSATAGSTDTPAPTATAAPTDTPAPTDSPAPTETPAPPDTPEPTLTPSPTLSPRQATALARAEAAAATAEVVQATATARAEQIEAISNYLPVNVKVMSAYPDNFDGAFVYFKGRVFNIINADSGVVQVDDVVSREPVYVEAEEPLIDIYERDTLVIYGKGGGTKCFMNTRNAEVCHPLITKATLIKGRLDPVFVQAQATARVVVAKQTAGARGAESTAQAEVRATARAQAAEYGWISNGELLNYTMRHIGEKVRLRGRVLSVFDNGAIIQMYLAGTYDTVIAVLREPVSGIYENDNITLYGTISDVFCGTNALGGEVCAPKLTDAFATKP